MSQKPVLPALCAIIGLSGSLTAASLPAAAVEPPLAIYYSFDREPPAPLVVGMQSELARILEPAGLRVAWRPLADARVPGESFREVVVMRFRGACAFDPAIAAVPSTGGAPLAETDLADGRVLPFGEVECEQLRRYILPEQSNNTQSGNVGLGRAMARVAAHEIYHMLTGSGAHARSGIARARHSRTELTASTFDFARPETDWLRSWVARGVEREPIPTAIAANTLPANSGASAPDGDLPSDSGVVASR